MSSFEIEIRVFLSYRSGLPDGTYILIPKIPMLSLHFGGTWNRMMETFMAIWHIL
jgi:hypothetical protein